MHITFASFQVNDTVYHKTNPQELGLVTGLLVRISHVAYAVTWPDREEKYHGANELVLSKNNPLNKETIGFAAKESHET